MTPGPSPTSADSVDRVDVVGGPWRFHPVVEHGVTVRTCAAVKVSLLRSRATTDMPSNDAETDGNALKPLST